MSRRTLLALALLMSALLAACGESQPEVDTQATEIAAGVAATLTAQAPPQQTVVVVTPPPPTEPPATPTAAPTPEPMATVDLMNIRLEADGSGDLATLEQALVESPVGATITLGPGIYRLERAITVGGSLHLVGAGREQTEIVSEVPDWVLRFEGDGPFTAEGITFRHEGAEPADVVAVTGGEVRFEHCRFTGGVWTEEWGIGSGLFLDGSTSGEIRDCESVENGLHGAHLWGEAQVLLAGNAFRDNDDTGIAYFEQGGGAARDNECSGNGVHGIYVDDRAAPTLEGNTLRDNGDTGIAYFGYAAGLAQSNVCAGNEHAGIYVAENAAPWLADNECELAGTAVETPAEPSAAGREIAFASWWDDNEDIYAMYADGTGTVRLTDDPARDNAPAWSPLGTRLAFVSERDGNAEIYVMNADGSGQTRLTDHPGQDRLPAWSPDGARIAYSSEEGDIWGIYVIDATGGERTLVSPEGMGGTHPSWSPDGGRLVVSVYLNRKPLLAVLNPGTGELISLTRESDQDSQPAWSPDGERIAFVSTTDEDGNYIDQEIYVINANGLGRTRLTNSPDSDTGPAWSPDGTQITFTSTRDGYGVIYRMNADGTELIRLTRDSNPSSYPAWSPVAAPASRGPRFNPGGDFWCFNTPELVAAGDWQVVAPREIFLPGEVAEIGLRDNQGQGGDAYPVTARIIAPDESEASASTTLPAGEWLLLVYPDDFAGAGTGQRGAYTIIWESDGVFIACDGFVVGGGASP